MTHTDEDMKKIYAERNRRFELLSQKRKSEKNERLARAKDEAALSGKELFNLDEVFKYYLPYDHEKDFLTDPEILELKRNSLEDRYYLSYPHIKTLKEFGEKMCELREWGAFD